MLSVTISTIPHEDQRYNTPGDWVHHQGEFAIRVSSTGNWLRDMCIAVHELIEATVATHQGLTTYQVDDFDLNWTPHDGITEPGEDPFSPYYFAHQFATGIERLLATQLGVYWHGYETKLKELENAYPRTKAQPLGQERNLNQSRNPGGDSDQLGERRPDGEHSTWHSGPPQVQNITRGDLEGAPVGMCGKCSRKIWDKSRLNQLCLLTQPDGNKCHGTFIAI